MRTVLILNILIGAATGVLLGIVLALVVGCGGDPTGPDDTDASALDAQRSAVPATDVTPDARNISVDALYGCSTETCDPLYGYCKEDGITCQPWPTMPPLQTWECYRIDHDNLGCCVSVCQHECEIKLEGTWWDGCKHSCETRCKDLLE